MAGVGCGVFCVAASADGGVNVNVLIANYECVFIAINLQKGAARESMVVVAWNYRERIAETRDRTGDLQIFGLTLSQLSYRGN